MVTINAGDTVQIIGNIPAQFTDGNRPIMGTVVKIDGEYHSVKTDFGGWVFEFYRTELRALEEMTKEDWTRYAVRRHGANGNMGKMAESRGDSLRGWPERSNKSYIDQIDEIGKLPKKPKPIRIQIRKIHQLNPPSKTMRKIIKLGKMVKDLERKQRRKTLTPADIATISSRIARKISERIKHQTGG